MQCGYDTYDHLVDCTSSSLPPVAKQHVQTKTGQLRLEETYTLDAVRFNSVPYQSMSYADPAAVPAGLTASAGGRALACPPGAAPSPCQTPGTPTVASPPVHLPHLSLRLPAESEAVQHLKPQEKLCTHCMAQDE